MRALVLSGGGVKGAYQVGALKKWIGDDGHDYDIFCGTSVGALNSAYLSQYGKGETTPAWEALRGLWSRVDETNVKKSWFPFGLFSALWKSSAYDSAPLRRWVLSELDVAKIKRSSKQLRVVACSWNSGNIKIASEKDEDIAQWVLASSSYPVLLSPIPLRDELWTDGGLRVVTPLGEAIRAGATHVDVIMCSDPEHSAHFEPAGKAAIPSFLMRAIDVCNDAVMVADLKTCGLKNRLAKLDAQYRDVTIRLLQPRVRIAVDSLDFAPKGIEEMIKVGYEDAQALGERMADAVLAKSRRSRVVE
jgi:predicted acylesterase/phospholipase RssA